MPKVAQIMNMIDPIECWTHGNNQNLLKSLCPSNLSTCMTNICISNLRFVFPKLCSKIFCQAAQKWSILHLLTPLENKYLTALKSTKKAFILLRYNCYKFSGACTLKKRVV